MSPLAQLAEPKASGILFAACSNQSGASPMDQQGAQIAVAAFADARQSGASSTRPLLRHQPQPCGKLPAILEAFRITDGDYQRCCRYRTNAFDFSKALTHIAIAKEIPNPPIIGCNSPIKLGQLHLQLAYERADQVAKTVIAAPDNVSKAPPQPRDVAGDDNSMFRKKPSNSDWQA